MYIGTLHLQLWVVFFLDASGSTTLLKKSSAGEANTINVDDFGVTSSVMVMHPFQVYFAPLTPALKVRMSFTRSELYIREYEHVYVLRRVPLTRLWDVVLLLDA